MENCVRTARQAGVFQEFHVLTDRALEGCECYDAMECDKAQGLFKLHYLKVGMSRLPFEYFVWLDADTVFVRNPVNVLGPLGRSPLHVPLELNLSLLKNDTNWKGVSVFALRDLFRREGVINEVHLSQSAFWIVHREAIETVYDLTLKFWHKATEVGLLLDVSAVLSYAMQILCAEPEKHLLVRARDLWASDDAGYFDERSPDGQPWPWQHPLAAEAVQVRPAIIHVASSKTVNQRESTERANTTLSRTDKMLLRARECSLNGHHFEALQSYESLTRRLGRNSRIWFEYGTEAAALMKFDLAEQAWQMACQLAPKDTELLLQIGHQYKWVRLPEKARAFYQRAAALNPRAANPSIGLAILYEESNSLLEAREMVLRGLATSPHDEEASYMHAHLDRREGKLLDAERQLRDLIASDPKHPYVTYAARFELANILDQLGNVDEAMNYLGQAKDMVRTSEDAKRLSDTFHANTEAHLRWLRTLPKDILHVWAQPDPRNHSETISRVAFLGGHPRSGTTLLEQILRLFPRPTLGKGGSLGANSVKEHQRRVNLAG
jgi:tetratricopeptide (TPR) repeat protein